MSINIKLKIGNHPIATSSATSLLFSLKQTDVSGVLSKIKDIVTSGPTPHLLIKIPKSLEPILSEKSPLQDYTSKWKMTTKKQTIKDVSYLLGFYNEEMVKFISKLQHIFKQISKFDNHLRMKIKESDIAEGNQLGFVENSVISLEGQIDKQTTQTIKKALKDVSPGFLNSPLMAILQLFNGIQADIEFDKISDLSLQQKNAFLNINPQKYKTHEFSQKLLKQKQKLDVSFCIPNLFSISGTISPSVLSLLLFDN